MENTGSNNGNFNFSPKSGDTVRKNETKPDSVVEEIANVKTDSFAKGSIDEVTEERMNAEYVDHRSVTVQLVHNYSLYRKANSKSLHGRRDYIGSSLKSSRTLTSNQLEINTYFPKIVGVSPSNENFLIRVKQYLNNIQIPVDELGKKFDVSFRYRHYKDYLQFKKKEDKIEDTYRLEKQSNRDIKKALHDKITALNDLESSKYQYGEPINIDDYIMYRHCLLYNDIAKDTALINSDSSIRFYFQDDQKEADNKRKLRAEINRAKSNYVSMLADDDLFDAIYAQYCVSVGNSVIVSAGKDQLEKESELDKFSTEQPVKFNKFFNDNDIKIKALIEILIERGELIRAKYNQNITTPDGDFIGSNIKEAVAWFKNPQNSNIIEAYKNKIKNA